MKDINIYSEDKVISRILVRETMDELGDCLDRHTRVFAVADANVAALCPEWPRILHLLEKKKIPVKTIAVSEKLKNMDTVLSICSWLLDSDADRSSLVLAIGGGLITDMTGFAASIYKRGLHFAFVPTTLLSQVDAAIGGKTGVNHEGYKNMLGVIAQPDFTYICPSMLGGLPYRDFRSGASELLKTFIIEDGGNYVEAVRLLTEINKEMESGTTAGIKPCLLPSLTHLIGEAAAVKAGVVTLDQFEKGERRKLNFGHTFAHAIEKCAREDDLDITHGEAVSIGMVMAAAVADRRYDTALKERFVRDFTACGLPVRCPFPGSRLAGSMLKDKKMENGILHFIMARSIGDTVVVDLPVAEVLGFLGA